MHALRYLICYLSLLLKSSYGTIRSLTFDLHQHTKGVERGLDQRIFSTSSMVQCIGTCALNAQCCTATYNPGLKLCVWDSQCCPQTEETDQEDVFITTSGGFVYMPTFKGYLKFYKIFHSWNEARSICQSENADLVIIDSAVKSDAIADYLTTSADCDNWWIGGNDSLTEGEFVWVNGVKVDDTFTNWKWNWGEPNDRSGDNTPGADCITMINNDGNKGKWFDTSCSLRLPFICSKDA